jgi:hypothetical protein
VGTRARFVGCRFGIATGLLATTLVVGSFARAADDEWEGAKKEPPVEKPAPPVNDAPVEEAAFMGQLPPSAYPDSARRGIRGGSLWLEPTLNGLAWPYMPRTGLGLSGSAWVDTGYEQITRGAGQFDTKKFLQEARAVLRVTPTYTRGDFFIQAQAELVANKDQSVDQSSTGGSTVDTDDLWVRFGSWKLWNIQLGRYPVWEVYHLGMGLDLNTLERKGPTDDTNGAPVDPYLVSFAGFRPAGLGFVSAHIYPTSKFRMELLGEIGNEGGNTLGGRPSAILDLGWVKLKAAGEYRKTTGNDTAAADATGAKAASKLDKTDRGFGGQIQFVLNQLLEFGGGATVGLTDTFRNDGSFDTEASFTVKTYGGFANARLMDDLLVGVGLDRTTKVDQHRDPTTNRVGNFSQLQAFWAVQYLLFKQLYIKGVVGYARAEFFPGFATASHSDTMISSRIRLMYLF